MMKKILTISIILLAFYVSKAQDYHFGFTVEPTVSWITTDDLEIHKEGTKLGFKFGIIGEKSIGDNFGFSAGLKLGFGLGGGLKHDNGGKLLPESELSRDLRPFRDSFPRNTIIDYRVGVFEIPVSFRLQSNQIGYLRYFAEFPILTLGFLTSAKGDITSTTVNATKENVIKDVSTLYLNWGVGGGIEYEANSGTIIVLGVYYNANLNDFTTDKAKRYIVTDTDSFVETEESKGLMKQLSLRVGVKF